MGILSNSPLNFLGHVQKDGLHLYYGVPQGCVVRNTFLEWAEEHTPSERPGSGSPLTAEPGPAEAQTRMRRAKSLPQEMFSAIRSISHDGQHSSHEQTARTPHGRDSLSRSLPATPNHTDDEQRSSASSPTPDSRSDQGQPKAQKCRTSGGASLVLRGLPFNVSEADVLAFIEQAGCGRCLAENDPITLLSNQQGRPSGFAEVQLARSSDFWEVQEKLHMQRLGTRYVEALPPRGGKDRWGMTPTSQRAAKRDSWRRLKGQSGVSSARWQHHIGASSPEWAGWTY